MIRRVNFSSICRPPNTLNLIPIRTSFYNKYKHGPTSISNPRPDYIKWFKSFFGPEGLEFIKTESRRIFIEKPFRTTINKRYQFNQTYKFEDFDSDESIKRWKPVADSDSLNGFSISKIVRSPAGHALFKGILDTRIPDDGVTMKSGFTGIIGPRKPRDSIFSTENHWDWSSFNSIEIKFKGDGRKYMLVLNTSTYTDDQAYYDMHGFPLYTRGGPYWQTYRIPFSKFVFANKGLIQDEQGELPVFLIKFVAITLDDTIDGPFALEIDYIGLRKEAYPFEEATAYEQYSFPHLKYKQIQVDCPPPEQHPT